MVVYISNIKILLLFYILFLIASCGKPKLKYYWINYDRGEVDTTFIKKIDVDSFPSGAKTYLYIGDDTTHYFVRPDTLQGSQVNLYWKTNRALRLVMDTSLVSEEENYRIFTFAERTGIIDSGRMHYWEPKYGIFAKHTSDYRKLTILQTDDTVENKKIKFLVQRMIPDSVLRDRGISQ